MCQPKPGPRCSSSVKKQKDAARFERDRYATKIYQISDTSQHAQDKLKKLTKKFHKACLEYDATPEGLEYLEGQIDTSSDKSEMKSLIKRYDKAIKKREDSTQDLSKKKAFDQARLSWRVANTGDSEFYSNSASQQRSNDATQELIRASHAWYATKPGRKELETAFETAARNDDYRTVDRLSQFLVSSPR